MIECCEGVVRDCCLKSYWVIYFSNMWWDHIPDVNCSRVKREHCSVDAASCGYVIMATTFYGFHRPGSGVMLAMLFDIV